MSNDLNTDLAVPFPSSYWVIPGLLLADEYPGAKEPREASQKLNSLVQVGIHHIINLMEIDETDHVGKQFTAYDPVVAGLAKRIGCSITCERRSIKDMGVTDPSRMIHTLNAIDQAIKEGKPVYVHCWGGVGRTGTVIGCFLMRHGMATSDTVIETIKRLRRADPKARRPSPENQGQVDFVTSWLDHEEGTPTQLNRYLGCMLGGAVGDALGAPVEFMSLAQIRAKYGESGIDDYSEAYGRIGAITDDTQMTLFTAEGLSRAWQQGPEKGICDAFSAVHHAYVQWLNTQGETSQSPFDQSQMGCLIHIRELHHRRAPGNSCLSALRGQEMGTMDVPVNDSKGCGGVMRVAPVGLIAGDVEHAFVLGCETAAITHGHTTGYLASGVLSAVIFNLKREIPLTEAIKIAITHLRHCDQHHECLDAIEQAVTLAAQGDPSPEDLETLGGGWIAEEALAISLCCALCSEHEFAKGVLMAVNHSGDSDSTGAITGNILGCINGKSAISSRWLERLELNHVIEACGLDLFTQMCLSQRWVRIYQGHHPPYMRRVRRLMKTAKPSDWKTEVMPSKSTTVRLDRMFLTNEMKAIRRGCEPQQQEDKWFIYWKDNTLFFHRSWTGYCVYVVRFRPEGDSFRMVEADVNRDPEQYSETRDEKDVDMISYLVDVLLLHKEAVFPDDESSPEKRALKNWSQVGRAMFNEHPDGKADDQVND